MFETSNKAVIAYLRRLPSDHIEEVKDGSTAPLGDNDPEAQRPAPPDVTKMTWPELVTEGEKWGVYRTAISKVDLIKAIKQARDET